MSNDHKLAQYSIFAIEYIYRALTIVSLADLENFKKLNYFLFVERGLVLPDHTLLQLFRAIFLSV